MAADRARADEEDLLKVSSFQKGGWEQTRPTELDIDYALLADALGSAGAPVAEVHDATVVALAYVTGAQGANWFSGFPHTSKIVHHGFESRLAHPFFVLPSFPPSFLPSFLPCSRCNIGGYDPVVEQR